MSPEVLRTLLGRVPQMKSPAYLPQQYSRHPVIGQMYPGVIQCDGLKETSFSKSWTDTQNSCVEGILLTGVSLSLQLCLIILPRDDDDGRRRFDPDDTDSSHSDIASPSLHVNAIRVRSRMRTLLADSIVPPAPSTSTKACASPASSCWTSTSSGFPRARSSSTRSPRSSRPT
jgi:hypothetical protein